MKKLMLFLILTIVSLNACRQSPTKTPPYKIPKTALGEKAMVASAHPEATRVGLEILKQGGTAVDAAIAINAYLAPVAISSNSRGVV